MNRYTKSDIRIKHSEYKLILSALNDIYEERVKLDDIPDRIRNMVAYLSEMLSLRKCIYGPYEEDTKNEFRVRLYELKKRFPKEMTYWNELSILFGRKY